MSFLEAAGKKKTCLDDCHPTLQNAKEKGNENEKQNQKCQTLAWLFPNTQTIASLDHLSVGVACLAKLHEKFCLKWWKVDQKSTTKHVVFSKTKANVSQKCPVMISLFLLYKTHWAAYQHRHQRKSQLKTKRRH